MNGQPLLLIGQLDELEKSESSRLFERLHSSYSGKLHTEKLRTLEEFLQGQPIQPQEERRNYLKYLDILIKRCGLTDAYRAAFLKKISVPPASTIQDLGDLGKSLHDHISAANDALNDALS